VFSETDRLTAIRSCRSCPMCHHADLVTTLERRETFSARGRGMTLFAVEQGMVEMDSQVADSMYRFFVDGLCRHVCAGHIAHDEMVVDARRRLVAANRAPPAVALVKAHIKKVGNPWGESEPDLRALTGANLEQEVLVYFGPTARIKRPGVISALNVILDKAGIGFSVLDEEGDPGLLLHQLGEQEAGAAAAGELAEKIRRSGARTVVTPDAEAYQALKVGFGGRPAHVGAEILHTSEFLAKLLGRFTFSKPKYKRIAYHDPCVLARGAPCLSAPRMIVRHVTGADPVEIGLWNRELANCSGECGGVPFTVPELSKKAAERRVREAKDAAAELIVVGSPGAAVALDGLGVVVREVSEFVADSICGRLIVGPP
jgi:Fe-S oxidoreductase